MPVVIKDEEEIWVRKSNFQPIPSSKVKKIPKEDRIKKTSRIVYIYTKSEFDAFNAKHVQRAAFGSYTVLVKNEVDMPTPNETRKIVNLKLLGGEVDRRRMLMFVNLKKPYSTARWNSILKKLIPDTNNQMLFRNIIEINRKNIQGLRDKLEQNEYNELINMLENVSGSKYAVRHMYLLGKLLVV